MQFHFITLFPDIVRTYISVSILGRAAADGLISITYYDPRHYAADVRKTVDDKPYGGGPGMVMTAEPILKAVEDIKKNIKKGEKVKVILFAPGAELFTNVHARTLAKGYKHLILIAGRYEGIDGRVKKILRGTEYSIGSYVLTGGEIPSMIVLDAVARQIPGVLGSFDSVEEHRAASPEVYTRPEVLEWQGKKHRVPKVLLSGNHKEIDAWKEGAKLKQSQGTKKVTKQ